MPGLFSRYLSDPKTTLGGRRDVLPYADTIGRGSGLLDIPLAEEALAIELLPCRTRRRELMNVFTAGAGDLGGESVRAKEAAAEVDEENEGELGGRKRGMEGSGGGDGGRVVGTSGSKGASILPRIILKFTPGELVVSTVN